MAKVTFILGLCGSGKSHLAKSIPGVTVFDEGFVDDAVQHERLFSELRAGRDCVVVEIWYCVERFRRAIEAEINRSVPGTVIEYLCFKNDLVRANENCRKRPDKGDPEGHIRINTQISREYTCPPGAPVEEIFAL